MIRRLAFFLLAASASVHAAPQTSPVPVTVQVTRTAPDTWRLQYQFARPISAIVYDAVGPYRQQNWTVVTPGVTLRRDGDTDVVSAEDKPLDALVIDVRAYSDLIEKQYVPASRYTDGGVALFLGHFQGEVREAGRTADMVADFRLQGLHRDNVIAPPAATAAMPMRGYAYFGPQQPAAAGVADAIIDPSAQPWLKETLIDATARLSQYYEQAYAHRLKQRLRVQITIAGLDTPGLSTKGGAVQGQLVYTLRGQQFKGDHPAKRKFLMREVAHEMAHIWQLSGDHISLDGTTPWVFEGGAEAMAMDALLHSGLWTAEQVQAYAIEKMALCDKLGDTTANYDSIYACGYARHLRSGKDVKQVWRTLRARSERERQPIGAAMFDDAINQPGLTQR
jgi:hypothetical protein